MAQELVQRPVAVIATAGGTPSAVAAKAATSSVPIIFLTGGDPVRLGLVESLSRPGGNATGIGQFATILATKRVDLLRELLPTASSVMHLFNPKNRNAEIEVAEVQQAAQALRWTLHFASASTDLEIEGAFETIARTVADALLVMTDPFFDSRRERLVTLTMRQAIPAIYGQREYAHAGGLMSYGTNFADTYRQAGGYAARVLGGAKPADLPVAQPIKFELVINLRTAKALGLSIPLALQAQADEVRRREVMVGLVAAAWPQSAGAQAPNPNRRLGILTTTGENDPEWKAERTAFLEALKGFGWTEGQNLHVDYRFAAGDANRAAAFAKELVNLKPDALLTRSTTSVKALLAATRTIPIVFVSVSDPVGEKFAASLARPGGNATGFTNVEPTMGGKWLEMLKEIVPGVRQVGVLYNPKVAVAGGAFFVTSD